MQNRGESERQEARGRKGQDLKARHRRAERHKPQAARPCSRKTGKKKNRNGRGFEAVRTRGRVQSRRHASDDNRDHNIPPHRLTCMHVRAVSCCRRPEGGRAFRGPPACFVAGTVRCLAAPSQGVGVSPVELLIVIDGLLVFRIAPDVEFGPYSLSMSLKTMLAPPARPVPNSFTVAPTAIRPMYNNSSPGR